VDSRVLLFSIAGALYLVPSIVALRREHASRAGIVVLNVFLGWSLVAWVAALVWAACGEEGEAKVATPTTATRHCPSCLGTIDVRATVCGHCRKTLRDEEQAERPRLYAIK
jgi:hypothetical protein